MSAPIGSSDGEREAFENVVRGLWTPGYSCPRKDGVYAHAEVEAMWKVWQARAALSSDREMATIEQGPWKSGNEYLPYHPSASHVDPDYRDGWNACWRLTHQVSPAGPQEISRLTADEALQALADQAQELGMYDQPTDRRPNLGSITSAVVREMAPEAKAKDSVNQTGAQGGEPEAADEDAGSMLALVREALSDCKAGKLTPLACVIAIDGVVSASVKPTDAEFAWAVTMAQRATS